MENSKKIMPANADASTSKNSINNAKSIVTHGGGFVQHIENLPVEFLALPRFFKVGKKKSNTPKGWSNPDNQKLYSAIKGNVGFDICGHGQSEDFLMIDLDHVRDPRTGAFVNDEAEKWYNYIKQSFEDCYCELSLSGSGFHFFGKPSPNQFDTITNKDGKGILHLDPNDPDIKIELFYKTGGRYCYVTGNVYDCKPNAPIPAGVVVDEVLGNILRAIEIQNPVQDKKTPQPTNREEQLPDDIQGLVDAINAITPETLEQKGYLKHSDKGAPRPQGYICPWCGSGTHEHKTGALTYYTTPETHFTCHAHSCGGDIIKFLAKTYGMDNRGKEFFDLLKRAADDFNISYNPQIFERHTRTQIDSNSLKADLREGQKKLAAFNAEMDNSFEKLRDCQSFDDVTVFSAEIVQAAAFAKNYNAELYSAFARDVKLYGDKHKDVKADMNSWKRAVKNKAIELDARRCDLTTRINQLRAQIETAKFAATSDLLIPTLPDYQITQEFGIEKVSGEKLIPVAPRPILISSQVKDVDSGILKFRLAQMTPAGKWQKLPTFDAATISDSRAIIKLANDGLRVTSGNSALLVEYFDKLRTQLDVNLPTTYEVARCGWYKFDGQEHFIDPRRPCVVADDDGKNINVEVSSQSQFATCLTTGGSLDDWRKAYELAKPYPVARFAVATAVAPPLLKVLGERNFLTYIFGKTRGGKTTAATLAASAVGSEKMIRSFDATKNGLAGAAADVSDYCFIVDEKQVADNRLKEQFDNLVYALANGIGRTKLSKDSTLRKTQDWRTIALMTGETRMIEDNTIDGADTRMLSINAPDVIIPPDVCKQIRSIVKDNYGHALPKVIDKIRSLKPDEWQKAYEYIQQVFAEDYPNHLDEHRRYIALITVADTMLNGALYGNSGQNMLDAIGNAKEIFKLIPTTAEIDTTQKEIDFVRDFISRNQNQFISDDNPPKFIRGGIFGSLKDTVFIYIAVGVLKDACKSANINYGKLVDDLIAAGYFVPDDKTQEGRKTPLKFVQKKLGIAGKQNCFRIPRTVLEAGTD